MNIRFLILVMFVLTSKLAVSQKPLRAGSQSYNGHNFLIKQTKDYNRFIFFFKNSKKIPSNPKYVYDNKLPAEDVIVKLNNFDKLKQIIFSAVSPERLKELKQNNEEMRLVLYLKPDGKIIKFFFSVSNKTLLTERELFNIYIAIESKFNGALSSDKNLHEELNSIYLIREIKFH